MNDHTSTRRNFLHTLGILSAATVAANSTVLAAAPGGHGDQKLAIDGGTPVRKNRLHARPYGPQFYDEVEKREILEVIESRQPFRWWGNKSKVLQFEKAYAKHIGARFALGVTSGTTALQTAMAAIGVGPGDEVILPAWTWYADYTAIVMAGGLPVFAEIDESLAIDPGDIEARITPRTRAIIACHLQGVPADLDPILAIARKHKLRVVEDSAQCAGGTYKGKYVGSIADIGINSFQLSKTITSGEGGAVTTSDPLLFERAMRFHSIGALPSPYAEELKGGTLPIFLGTNFRMSEFTGAILFSQLQKLDTICKSLRGHAKRVRDGIADLPGIKLRKAADIEGTLGSLVFVDLGTKKRRDRFLAAMGAEGIGAAGPGGSVNLPLDKRIENKVTVHPAWPSFQSPEGKAICYGRECCPRTTDILGRFGGVMMDPSFTDQDIQDIIKAIRKVYPAVMAMA